MDSMTQTWVHRKVHESEVQRLEGLTAQLVSERDYWHYWFTTQSQNASACFDEKSKLESEVHDLKQRLADAERTRPASFHQFRDSDADDDEEAEEQNDSGVNLEPDCEPQAQEDEQEDLSAPMSKLRIRAKI